MKNTRSGERKLTKIVWRVILALLVVVMILALGSYTLSQMQDGTLQITPVALTALAIFVGAYVVITFEHQLKTEKAPVAMIAATVLWVLLSVTGVLPIDEIRHHLELAMGETASIVLFLLVAMTLVEYLVHYGLFDWVRIRLYRLGLDDRKQFYIIAVLTFFLSAILDNLTITIVMIQIALRFFTGRNLIIVAAGIVVCANAGGAWSPIGDVTTIMMWIAQKFTTMEIITNTFFPSLVQATVTTLLLGRKIFGQNGDSTVELQDVHFTFSELLVIFLCLGTFGLPLIAAQMGLQPFMGLFVGLGVVWIVIGYLKMANHHDKPTHLEADITKMMAKVDFPSLLFFVGILLSVGALDALGLLRQMSEMMLGADPSFERLAGVAVVFGYLSSLVDNVPLTAVAIDMFETTNSQIWTFMAYSVGTGGSHLAIGSVAGVVAMGMVKELTSTEYFKIATPAVAIGFVLGVIVQLGSYMLF
ncbi:MAG: sodium:proton antiporter NhaD [Weeksellaceae bacterium]